MNKRALMLCGLWAAASLTACGGEDMTPIGSLVDELKQGELVILTPKQDDEFYRGDPVWVGVKMPPSKEKVRAFLTGPHGKVRKRTIKKKSQEAKFKIGKKWPLGTYKLRVENKSQSVVASLTFKVIADGSSSGQGGQDGGSNPSDGEWGGVSCSVSGTPSYGVSAQEAKLFELIKDYRKSLGVVDAKPCRSLTQAAQWHANDMRDRGFYAHKRPDGPEFWDRACDAGYQHLCGIKTYAGEIITAWASTPENALYMWKGSPGHDFIMKSPLYKVSGVGHACGGKLGHYWVVKFAGVWEESCN